VYSTLVVFHVLSAVWIGGTVALVFATVPDADCRGRSGRERQVLGRR
jgi:hypothetical protein